MRSESQQRDGAGEGLAARTRSQGLGLNMTFRDQLVRRCLGPSRERPRSAGWFVCMAAATIFIVGFAMTLDGWFAPVAWLAAVIFVGGFAAEAVRARRARDDTSS